MYHKVEREISVSYIRLKDCSTSKFEYFRLYKDTDVGFYKPFQDLPESVISFIFSAATSTNSAQSIDDDCPTEEEQIRLSSKDLEREIKEGAAAFKESLKSADASKVCEALINAKFNPKLNPA